MKTKKATAIFLTIVMLLGTTAFCAFGGFTDIGKKKHNSKKVQALKLTATP